MFFLILIYLWQVMSWGAKLKFTKIYKLKFSYVINYVKFNKKSKSKVENWDLYEQGDKKYNSYPQNNFVDTQRNTATSLLILWLLLLLGYCLIPLLMGGLEITTTPNNFIDILAVYLGDNTQTNYYLSGGRLLHTQNDSVKYSTINEVSTLLTFINN